MYVIPSEQNFAYLYRFPIHRLFFGEICSLNASHSFGFVQKMSNADSDHKVVGGEAFTKGLDKFEWSRISRFAQRQARRFDEVSEGKVVNRPKLEGFGLAMVGGGVPSATHPTTSALNRSKFFSDSDQSLFMHDWSDTYVPRLLRAAVTTPHSRILICDRLVKRTLRSSIDHKGLSSAPPPYQQTTGTTRDPATTLI